MKIILSEQEYWPVYEPSANGRYVIEATPEQVKRWKAAMKKFYRVQEEMRKTLDSQPQELQW